MENNSILSPVMIWNGFRLKYPLQPMKTSEEVFDNVIYSEVYFSGSFTEVLFEALSMALYTVIAVLFALMLSYLIKKSYVITALRRLLYNIYIII